VRENEPDPFTGFRFRLSLGYVEVGAFSECSGLEIETRVFEYREGGRNAHALKFPEQTELKNLVLKRGLTSSTELFDWYMDVARGAFLHDNQRPTEQGLNRVSERNSEQDSERKISIALLDASGGTAMEWAVHRAFPVKWVGPELNATDNSVCFETIELAHEGIERIA
jgi:phage tail-like protein